MGTRRKSREMTMQMLFQGDLGKQTPEEVRRLFWASRDDVDDETRGFAEDLYRVATARAEEIDKLIEEHAQNWRLERMPAVDRNILRLAIYEMLYERDTPKLVVVDEAIELAKKFGSEQSGRFVNGLLDGLLKQHSFPGSLT